MITLIMTILLAVAVAMVFLVPSREVTQPPGKAQVFWEILAPGASPVWGVFGGLVLVGWIYFLVQDLFLFWKGSPYIIRVIATPNVVSTYRIPIKDSAQLVLRLINPSWAWVYLAPAVLFALNLTLVFRDKLFRKSV